MAAPTPAEFRAQHGDPTTWHEADFDEYEVLIQTGTTPFPIPTAPAA